MYNFDVFTHDYYYYHYYYNTLFFPGRMLKYTLRYTCNHIGRGKFERTRCIYIYMLLLLSNDFEHEDFLERSAAS